MRNLHELDKYRVVNDYITQMQLDNNCGDDKVGAFMFNYEGREIFAMATVFYDWDHVSVSLAKRCPNWYEMEFIARLFFKEDEIAIQLHLPTKLHVNIHPNVLHWWRPQLIMVPLPPKDFV
jgi:hypothetical protein